MDDLLISCFQLKDLDIAIVKATNHVESPPKERHIASEFIETFLSKVLFLYNSRSLVYVLLICQIHIFVINYIYTSKMGLTFVILFAYIVILISLSPIMGILIVSSLLFWIPEITKIWLFLNISGIIVATSITCPRADVAYCIHALSKRLSKTRNWIVSFLSWFTWLVLFIES